MLSIVGGESRWKTGTSCSIPALLARCLVTIVADVRPHEGW